MKHDWNADELLEHWTLLSDEKRLLANKSGATRLGLAGLALFERVAAASPWPASRARRGHHQPRRGDPVAAGSAMSRAREGPLVANGQKTMLRNGSRLTSRIDVFLEHAAERHEDRSHAGACERGFLVTSRLTSNSGSHSRPVPKPADDPAGAIKVWPRCRLLLTGSRNHWNRNVGQALPPRPSANDPRGFAVE